MQQLVNKPSSQRYMMEAAFDFLNHKIQKHVPAVIA